MLKCKYYLVFCVGELNSFQWLCRSIRLFLPYFPYLGVMQRTSLVYCVVSFNIKSHVSLFDGHEQRFKSFYLSSPAALFEVKVSVSKGTIKWTPYSAELLDATIDSFQSQKK